jgi:hypothetical protein
MPNLPFELLDYYEAGNVVYQGPWLIVDNGYLKKSITVPPLKHYGTEPEYHWS